MLGITGRDKKDNVKNGLKVKFGDSMLILLCKISKSFITSEAFLFVIRPLSSFSI